jgi:hypothetical protein
MTPAWLPDHVRFTFFFDRPVSAEAGDWFKVLAGTDPESSTSRSSVGERLDTASVGGLKVSLQIALNVAHWIVQAANGGPIGDLDSFEVIAPAFVQKLRTWSERVSGVNRVALGTHLYFSVASPQASYKKLQEYLPSLNLEYPKIRDFELAVNVPKKSSTRNDMELNALTRWSCVQFHMFAQVGGSIQNSPLSHYCKVDMDFSSPNSATSLSSGEQMAIFDELVDLVKERSTKGVQW